MEECDCNMVLCTSILGDDDNISVRTRCARMAFKNVTYISFESNFDISIGYFTSFCICIAHEARTIATIAIWCITVLHIL